MQTVQNMDRVTMEWRNDRGNLVPDPVDYTEVGPKKLLLHALGRCSGATVIMLLSKMAVSIETLRIEVEADLSDGADTGRNIYTTFRVRYDIARARVDDDLKIDRAVRLAHDKYCSVAQMLRRVGPVSYEVRIHVPESVRIRTRRATVE